MKNGKTNGNPQQLTLTDSLTPATIGFRLLDDEYRRELAKRALRSGTTPHDLARAYVIDALRGKEEIPEMREAILSLHAELVQLRRDLALSVEIILLSMEADTKVTIQDWVKKNLHRD